MNRVIIRGGLVFDGSRADGRLADVLVEGDTIVRIDPDIEVLEQAETIDATGCWVTPGFIDVHTHYDAELEVSPALTESVRHGVTTVMLGSCGLSMAVGDPEDLADMFCRVEGIPRGIVLPLLQERVSWRSPAGYLDHLDRMGLGPNVACLLGHSTIRAAAMGMDRALDASVRPSREEREAMSGLLIEALDAGYLGLSINTLPWDKMDGERHRSLPTPSVFGTWSEYRRLMKPLRSRGRILQGVPNLATKVNILLFALSSIGIVRPALKTTLIALMDPLVDRWACHLAGWLARFTNHVLGGNLRFQALPNPFDIWTDGLENPVIEEFQAGTRVLHERDAAARSALLRDRTFRRRFAKDWAGGLLGRAYHRDLDEPTIIDCPDADLIGRSFAAVAAERGQPAIETFLDLQAEYGKRLRWYSVVANDRPEVLAWILTRRDILIGFSDAGAHLRNMAYYNFPLRLLKRVRDGEVPGMDVAWAIHRLTAELADWFGIDAGRLQPGRRADIAVVRPTALNDSVEAVAEVEMPKFGGLRRVVRRNNDAVPAVLIGGHIAWRDGTSSSELGTAHHFGRVLRATL